MRETIFRVILLSALLALVTVAKVSAQTPRRASGIDSLGTGGDLGGNIPPATLVPVLKDGEPARTDVQRFTLCGRAATAAHRGQVVILRRRTPDGYVVEKIILR